MCPVSSFGIEHDEEDGRVDKASKVTSAVPRPLRRCSLTLVAPVSDLVLRDSLRRRLPSTPTFFNSTHTISSPDMSSSQTEPFHEVLVVGLGAVGAICEHTPSPGYAAPVDLSRMHDRTQTRTFSKRVGLQGYLAWRGGIMRLLAVSRACLPVACDFGLMAYLKRRV